MAKAKSKSKTKDFRTWLSQFVEESSPLGDLARDAGADSGWTGKTRKSLKERLIDEAADFAAFEAFAEASKRYSEEMRKADSQPKSRKSLA